MMRPRHFFHPIVAVMCLGLFCIHAGANPVGVADKAAMDRAVSAAVNKDYFSALAIFQVYAAQGDAVAQYNLGLMYLNGLAVPANAGQAHYWVKQSALQGYPKAKGLLERLP